jgi:hypothetical protein
LPESLTKFKNLEEIGMRFFRAISVLVCLICLTTLANADPVRVTSGSVTNGTINISGSGFSYNLTVSGGNSVFTFSTPYQPGSTIRPTINSFTTNGITGYNVYRGTANFNGVNYLADFGGGFAPVNSSNLVFNLSQGINLPNTFPPPISGINVLSVSVPFTMTGYLVGRNCPQVGPCTDVPGQSLFGNGTATLNFAEFNGTYRLNTYSYNFSSTPEPTPEPATLILLGTGLAGIVGYAKRRRRKSNE